MLGAPMRVIRDVAAVFVFVVGLVGCRGGVVEGGADAAAIPPIDASTPDPIDAARTDDVDAAVVVPDEWEVLDPLPDGAWVRVRNHCPFSLWIHAAGSTGVLEPDDAELTTGQTRDYQAPASWSAARVTAYRNGPRAVEVEKAEMTFQPSSPLVLLNYNITYVDWVGLPMRVAGAGGECGPGHLVECTVRQADLVSGCPAHLLRGDVCESARSHCLNPVNQGSEYCTALDDEVDRCASMVPGCGAFGGASTPEVYACSGPLSEEPRLCAALNRGMLDDPDDGNASHHYVYEPHNTYAAWVHDVCPGIYAFSYDDWLAGGGFRACRGSELRITFCPGG